SAAAPTSLGAARVLAQARPQQCDDRPLLVPLRRARRVVVVLGSPDEGGPDPPVEVRVDDRRMNVRLARDRDGVAEVVGGGSDRLRDVALLLAVGRAIAVTETAQRAECEDRPGPGPEVLGGHAGRNRRKVAVDVVRGDVVRLAVIADVLEQLAAGEVAAAPDHGREPPVTEPDLVLLAGLAAEAERDRRPVDPGVAIVER